MSMKTIPLEPQFYIVWDVKGCTVFLIPDPKLWVLGEAFLTCAHRHYFEQSKKRNATFFLNRKFQFSQQKYLYGMGVLVMARSS